MKDAGLPTKKKIKQESELDNALQILSYQT